MLRVNPDFLDARLKLAITSLRLKDLDSAYAMLGRRDEARDAFDSCLLAAPEEEECKRALRQLGE